MDDGHYTVGSVLRGIIMVLAVILLLCVIWALAGGMNPDGT